MNNVDKKDFFKCSFLYFFITAIVLGGIFLSYLGDGAVAQAHRQHQKYGIITHSGDIAQQAKHRRQNEHQAAHHRRTGLIIVPGGTHFPDGLAGLQRPEHRDQQTAEHSGQYTGHSCGHENICHK